MDFRKRRICPCCNKPLSKNLKIIKGGLDKKTEKNILKRVWMGLGKTDHFDYVRCNKCNSLYNYEYPSETLINELYSSMPPNMEEAVNTTNQVKNQNGYAKIISKSIKSLNNKNEFSFIELGADRGLLIKELSKTLDKKFLYCVGIEPNSLVNEDLSKNLDIYSHNNSIYKDIAQMGIEENNKFNLAACIHILDHCFKPKDVLGSIQKKLVSNGILLVVVHNPESSLAKLLGKKWPPYCSQHPQLFTKKGMSEISAKTGFKLVKEGKTLNYFSLSMVTSFFGLNIEFAKKINVKLPLGNMYYILQKC